MWFSIYLPVSLILLGVVQYLQTSAGCTAMSPQFCRREEVNEKEGVNLTSTTPLSLLSPSLLFFFFFLSEDNRVAFICAEWFSPGSECLNVWLAVRGHAHIHWTRVCVYRVWACTLKLIREKLLSNSFHPQLEIIEIPIQARAALEPPSGVSHAAERGSPFR